MPPIPPAECPFTPRGLEDLQLQLNATRHMDLQHHCARKLVAADLAFLASGSRTRTPHVHPGTQLGFDPLFVEARSVHVNKRHDFTTRTKSLLTDMATALDRMSGSTTVQIHFATGQPGSRAHTPSDIRTEVYISPEVMAKVPTARTTLLRMVQLFIEGIAIPVGQKWMESFNAHGFRAQSVVIRPRQVRQVDPLNPKPLNGLPTYVLWGLNNDELGRLQEEDGYEAGNAEARASEAAAQREVMDALRDEIARLRNDKIRLTQQVEDQDILIAHMMARQERLETNESASSDGSVSPEPSTQRDEPEDLPSYVIYPPNTHPTIPSVIVTSHNNVETPSELRDSAAWRRRPFGTKTTQYMAENALHSTWNTVVHKVAYEHAPAEWGRRLYDILMRAQSEGVAGARLALAFGLADAMCDDCDLTLEYNDLQGRYY